MGGLIGIISEQLDVFAVVTGRNVITVGSRFKKINHINKGKSGYGKSK